MVRREIASGPGMHRIRYGPTYTYVGPYMPRRIRQRAQGGERGAVRHRDAAGGAGVAVRRGTPAPVPAAGGEPRVRERLGARAAGRGGPRPGAVGTAGTRRRGDH